MSQSGPRRYILPSTITGAAVAILPALFLGILITDMSSPSWDSNGDSGVSAGTVIFSIEALVMVAYAALMFPVVALWLHRQGRYQRGSFVVANFAGLAIVSAGVAAAVSFAVFGSGTVYIRQLAFMLIEVAVLCLPFSLLWWRLAK